jgi:hypothetical protein
MRLNTPGVAHAFNYSVLPHLQALEHLVIQSLHKGHQVAAKILDHEIPEFTLKIYKIERLRVRGSSPPVAPAAERYCPCL